MCNGCNTSNGCSSCGSGCGCNQNSLWNILFNNTQRVCRNSCGNLVVNNSSCGSNQSSYGCSSCNSCNCGCNNSCSNGCNGGCGYLTSAAVDNGYTCASNVCQNYDNAYEYSSGCGFNSSRYNRCSCNAYAAWTQENYGE